MQDRQGFRVVSTKTKTTLIIRPNFVSGLTEAVSAVHRGNRKGIQAIRDAIVLRSGSRDFRSYEPGYSTFSGDMLAGLEAQRME